MLAAFGRTSAGSADARPAKRARADTSASADDGDEDDTLTRLLSPLSDSLPVRCVRSRGPRAPAPASTRARHATRNGFCVWAHTAPHGRPAGRAGTGATWRNS